MSMISFTTKEHKGFHEGALKQLLMLVLLHFHHLLTFPDFFV
jgi:hypothetical protein